MAQKPETRLSNKLRKIAESWGANVLKVHGSTMQRKGEPDHIGGIVLSVELYNGVIDEWEIPYAIELKMPDNEATDLQKHRLAEWARVGYATGVAYNLVDYVQIWLDHIAANSYELYARVYDDYHYDKVFVQNIKTKKNVILWNSGSINKALLTSL